MNENNAEQLRSRLDIPRLRNEFEGAHYLLTTSDGITLFIQEWKSKKPSDVAILIFHGITAYSGPYGQIIGKELTEAGMNILGMNLRGHGLSDGVRGDYPSRKRVIKDICEAIEFAKTKYAKIIVLGHSLGAVAVGLATNHCLDKIDGIILVGAGRTIRPGVYKKPTASQKCKILATALFSPGKRIIKYYRDGMMGLDDPLFNFAYSPRFMMALSVKSITFPSEIPCPVLMAIGENDEIFSQESARALLDEMPAKDKTIIVIPGAKHAAYPPGSWTKLIEWYNARYAR
nr:alpha/beta fold hydrolase [Candidatus Sigynarchaeota archaeon]